MKCLFKKSKQGFLTMYAASHQYTGVVYECFFLHLKRTILTKCGKNVYFYLIKLDSDRSVLFMKCFWETN